MRHWVEVWNKFNCGIPWTPRVCQILDGRSPTEECYFRYCEICPHESMREEWKRIKKHDLFEEYFVKEFSKFLTYLWGRKLLSWNSYSQFNLNKNNTRYPWLCKIFSSSKYKINKMYITDKIVTKYAWIAIISYFTTITK